MNYEVGKAYTRNDIFALLGLQPMPTGGNWFTGYTEHDGETYIFCGIGTAGRTGHDYHNQLDGSNLRWFGKNGSRRYHQPIQAMLLPGAVVHVFYRRDDRSPFTYGGRAIAVSTVDSSPVEVHWKLIDGSAPFRLAEEIANPGGITEGAKSSVTVNRYERDPRARERCIARWGLQCNVCAFDFERRYGAHGRGYIHVHHLKPLAEIGESYILNPESDLRPVCPNCHAMIHRQQPALTIEAAKALLRGS